jgi:signal transduction histidine kinase/ligand-binding sensor domain-containing protein
LINLNQNYSLLFKTYILFLFLVISFSIWTQSNTGQFINYGVEDGLCEAFCSGIAQDSRGFYWISTQGGINRFDGTNFKAYYPSEFLGEKQLLDKSAVFFECVPNHMLVTLGNSEAYILNTISQDLSPIKSLKNKLVNQFSRIDKNRIVVSSVDTVFILNNNLEIIQTLIPPMKEKGLVVRLNMLNSSSCLINSPQERFVYNFKTKQFQPFHTQLPTEGLLHTGYEVLYVDQFHHWIYLTNYFKGLFQVDYQGKILFSWDPIILQKKMCILPNRIIQDKNNENYVWVTGNTGISHLNLITRQATNYRHNPQIPLSILDNQTNNLFIDQSQNLWITSSKGISVLNRNTTLIDDWDLNLSWDEPIMNLCRISKEELLAVKYYDGVYQMNERTNQLSAFHKKQLVDSWFIFKDGLDLIHGGKGTNLQAVNLKTNRVTELSFLKKYFKQSDLVVLGFRHSSGSWWFSGNAWGGLVRYNPKTKQINHFSRGKASFSGSYFTTYSETPNGDLWFSSNKTQVLTHWIRAEDRFEEVNFEQIFEKPYQSTIQCITTDQKGNVWIGFEGTGLVYYDVSTKKTTVFGKEKGIPSNFIYNLVFDNRNRLWIGTKKGLVCLGSDLKNVQCFGVENGFPSEHFDQNSYFDAQTGMLWVACDKYLLRFFPDKLLKTENLRLKVFIDEFLVSNRKQPLENIRTYHFSPNQNTIQLTFSTINLLNKNKIEYSYLLEGSSKTWVSLGTNSRVVFPSLPSGVYTFRLRSKVLGTRTWVYLKEPLHFIIATPWYRTWWFKIIIILIGVGIIFLITRMFFLRKIEKQQAILERQLAVQNERDRIAYDMHDDLGSGLTKISYLSKEALRKNENEAELERINETSLELVKNMSELIWAMKVENDSLVDLMTYLRQYAMEYFEINQIEIQMELDEFREDQQISSEVRRQVFLIFKEALHNIVKHALTKRVLIQIQINEKIQILIRDYGQGFRNEEGKQRIGNGMKTMQERTRKLNGTMKVKSGLDGVELIFEIPYSNLNI